MQPDWSANRFVYVKFNGFDVILIDRTISPPPIGESPTGVSFSGFWHTPNWEVILKMRYIGWKSRDICHLVILKDIYYNISNRHTLRCIILVISHYMNFFLVGGEGVGGGDGAGMIYS